MFGDRYNPIPINWNPFKNAQIPYVLSFYGEIGSIFSRLLWCNSYKYPQKWKSRYSPAALERWCPGCPRLLPSRAVPWQSPQVPVPRTCLCPCPIPVRAWNVRACGEVTALASPSSAGSSLRSRPRCVVCLDKQLQVALSLPTGAICKPKFSLLYPITVVLSQQVSYRIIFL